MTAITGATLENRLRRHVNALAGDIGERNVWRPEALESAARYIEAELSGIGYEVAAQSYGTHGASCRNLEVTVPGRSKGIVLAGAHYDTVAGSPGADDNASGVAGLIEIARALRTVEPACTVKLVAFVNEEPPFFFFGEMGSKVYAEAARRRGDDIRAMLSLEMLGCYSDARGSQAYPPLLKWFYPDRGDFIAFVSNLRRAASSTRWCARSAPEATFRGTPREPRLRAGVSWSDQLSFWRAGYPALMVTDTAFFRYPHYHQPTDTPDRIRFPEMARVVDGLAKAIAVLASAQTG